MKILFVCTGNTCRSPMAEYYLKSLGIYAESRGLLTDGSGANQNSVAVMNEIGINIESHVSKQLTADDIKNFNKIICMSQNHCDYLKANGVEATLLGDGIPDPYGCDIDTYRDCRDKIISAIGCIFEKFDVFEMQNEDIVSVAEIEKACFSTPWTYDGILEAQNHKTHFFVFKQEQLVVGYVGMSVILDEGYITNVAVLPDYRKSGVASLLLSNLICFGKSLGLSFISLEVRQSNEAAVKLYEKFGFKTEGLRKGFYDKPKEDALIMTKRF